MFEALFQSSCKYEVPLKLNLRILVVPIQKNIGTLWGCAKNSVACKILGRE